MRVFPAPPPPIASNRGKAAGVPAVRLASGDAYALVTAVLFGSSYALGKPVLAAIGPVLFADMRVLGAGAVLLAIAALRPAPVPLTRADLLRLAGAGFVGVTLFQTAWTLGLSMTPASEGSVLIATSAIWGVILGRLRGERPGMLAWAGVLIAFAGVFVVVNRSATTLNLGHGSLLGDVCWLAAAALWATFTRLSVPLVERHGALRGTGWTLLLGGLGIAPWAGVEAARQDWSAVTPDIWGHLAFVTLATSALGNVTWYAGLRRLGATRVMVYVYLVPVFAVLIAFATLDEAFTAAQGFGSAMVLAGVILSRLGPMRGAGAASGTLKRDPAGVSFRPAARSEQPNR